MFNLSYEQLNSPSLSEGLRVLGAQKLPTKAAWNLTRMIKQIDKEMAEGRDAYLDVLKKNVELTEEGEIKPALTVEKLDAEGKVVQAAGEPIPNSYIELEDDSVKKAVKEFMEIQVSIESHKIDLDDLASIAIEAEVLGSLEAVILTREEKLGEMKGSNVQAIR